MNDTTVTVIGNVATPPRMVEAPGSPARVTFRLASTPRRLDRESGRWIDVGTSWYTVTCWRILAENVAFSFHKGDPVVVTGRQRVREWTNDEGRRGYDIEIDASHASHDLNRGRTNFVKVTRTREQVPAVGAAEADEPVDPMGVTELGGVADPMGVAELGGSPGELDDRAGLSRPARPAA